LQYNLNLNYSSNDPTASNMIAFWEDYNRQILNIKVNLKKFIKNKTKKYE
jgi:hypothetical protein